MYSKKIFIIKKLLCCKWTCLSLILYPHIISIDETSINALQKRNHCYNEIGKRCVIKTNSQEVFKKYTCIFAINNKGVIGWKLYPERKGGVKTNDILDFYDEFIKDKYKNHLVIMDNAVIHKSKTIRERIENSKNELMDKAIIAILCWRLFSKRGDKFKNKTIVKVNIRIYTKTWTTSGLSPKSIKELK